jgi:phosphatidylethanolamine/phosphatidyl-N-methylethanolamine N-methyltransferase
MNESLLFLGKFLRHGTAIASLAPSSPWLSRATVRNVDWARAKVLIELGAGTGPITQELVDRARDDCKLIVLERDPDFVRVLRDRFEPRPNLEIIGGDVRDLPEMLRDRGIDRVDNVISGLPVPSFPKELQRDLFRNVARILDPAGTYNQITELPWVYLRFYRTFFDEVRFAFEPRNIPPAGAYYCRGIRPID